MVSTRVLATWILFVGVVWLLVALWLMLVMSGISTPAVGLWLLYSLYYAAPLVLIAGAVLLLCSRCIRTAAILILLASAYLTYITAPNYVSMFQPRPPLERPMDYIDYSIFAAMAVVVLLTDFVAIVTAHHAVTHHRAKR